MKTILVLRRMLHGKYEVSPFAYAVLGPHGPPAILLLAGITRRGSGSLYRRPSRLEDGTWQQAADWYPPAPRWWNGGPRFTTAGRSGRPFSLTRYSKSSTARTARTVRYRDSFELAGVPSSVADIVRRLVHGQGPGPIAGGSGRHPGPWSHVFHPSDDFKPDRPGKWRNWDTRCLSCRISLAFPPSGITKVSGPEELPAAMEEAFRHDSAVILEETIPVFEVGCAVMGNEKLTEIWRTRLRCRRAFSNYEEKYTSKDLRHPLSCPHPVGEGGRDPGSGKTIYRALDCRVFARVDLFLTPDGGDRLQ